MADDLAALARREKERADALAAAAVAASRGAISATLARAAQLAVEAVQADQGRGQIGEAAADLRELRTDAKLLKARARDLDAAELEARQLITDALGDGYFEHAVGMAKVMERPGLSITVELSDADLGELIDYPIHGRTPSELARRLRALLGDAIDELLARPLTGSLDPGTIPEALGELDRLHSERVGNAVGEAYAFGAQAATAAIGRALVGD